MSLHKQCPRLHSDRPLRDLHAQYQLVYQQVLCPMMWSKLYSWRIVILIDFFSVHAFEVVQFITSMSLSRRSWQEIKLSCLNQSTCSKRISSTYSINKNNFIVRWYASQSFSLCIIYHTVYPPHPPPPPPPPFSHWILAEILPSCILPHFYMLTR
jgi:hypothetical protein